MDMLEVLKELYFIQTDIDVSYYTSAEQIAHQYQQSVMDDLEGVLERTRKKYDDIKKTKWGERTIWT